jgi:hypothetical protein
MEAQGELVVALQVKQIIPLAVVAVDLVDQMA